MELSKAQKKKALAHASEIWKSNEYAMNYATLEMDYGMDLGEMAGNLATYAMETMQDADPEYAEELDASSGLHDAFVAEMKTWMLTGVQNMVNEQMNRAELAQDMLDYEAEAHILEIKANGIKRRVLALGKTVVVGYTRATYNAGRKAYDYQDTADDHILCLEVGSDEDALALKSIKEHTTQPAPRTDWKKVCADLDLAMSDLVVKSQADPSVTLKIER